MIKWKITIEGLPNIFMDGSSSGLIRSQLRKIVKSPEMIQDIERITPLEYKKMLRAKVAGKDDEEDIEEDSPATSMGGGGIAGGGIDLPDQPGSGEPGVRPKKKKNKKITLIDGRRKEYKKHRERLVAQREKRTTRTESKFIQNIVDK